MPDAPDALPDTLYEVIDGVVVEKPLLQAYDMELASILMGLLHDHTHGRGRVLIEMLFDLRPAVDRQRRPDVSFVSAAKWPLSRRASRGAAWAIVPELAVEIVSPSNPATHVIRQVHEYFAAGVAFVWIIYPDQERVYAYESPTRVRVFGRGDDLDGGVILPGFRLAIVDLFEAPAEPE